MSRSSERTTKRRRVRVELGRASEHDSPARQIDAPSSSAFSTRRVLTAGIPSLSSLCVVAYVAGLINLANKDEMWVTSDQWKVGLSRKLVLLPDMLLHRIFKEMVMLCPHLLTSELIKQYFLRGSTILLSSGYGGGLPASVVGSIALVKSRASQIVNLSIMGFDRIEDVGIARVVSALPCLETLRLRACTRVGQKTIDVLVDNCPSLHSVNLNYTSVTPLSLLPLLRRRSDTLRVLKVAIPSWTDATFSKLQRPLLDEKISFPSLRTLKLRQCGLSDTSVNAFLPLLPNIRRLDLSFTRVRHLSDNVLHVFNSLEKLSLTSTDIRGNRLSKVLLSAPKLSILNIGALGSNQGQAHALGNTTFLSMTDEYLEALTEVLAKNQHLTSMSLVGNARIGQRRQPISEFLEVVGRRLKHLNLTGLPLLRGSDLSPLTSADPSIGAPRLEVLSLSRTSAGDEAASYIACCNSLRVLEVAGTRFTKEGLFSIIDSCSRLDTIDLTSCRGISVAIRRRFFEEWDKERNGADNKDA